MVHGLVDRLETCQLLFGRVQGQADETLLVQLVVILLVELHVVLESHMMPQLFVPLLLVEVVIKIVFLAETFLQVKSIDDLQSVLDLLQFQLDSQHHWLKTQTKDLAVKALGLKEERAKRVSVFDLVECAQVEVLLPCTQETRLLDLVLLQLALGRGFFKLLKLAAHF